MQGDLRAVFIYGRLRGRTRARISDCLVKRNCRLARNALTASAIVLAHAAAPACLGDRDRIVLPFSFHPGATLVSEESFARELGLPAPELEAPGPYEIDDVARLSGLAPQTCRALALFDVIAGGGANGYRDLATAKQVARLLADGVRLASIVEAAAELARRGLRVSQVRLAETPWGEIVQRLGGQVAQLDGQFALGLEEDVQSADETFNRAQACEQDGDLVEAERLYRRAEQRDKADPVIAFNLGNVLEAQGRTPEAMLAFRRALDRDGAFADAAFNLARLHEANGQHDEALAFYLRTIAAEGVPEGLYNCARLLTRLERHDEALPLWDRFIAERPDDPDIGHARRLALLCRLQLR